MAHLRRRRFETRFGEVELVCLMSGCYRTSDDRYYLEDRAQHGDARGWAVLDLSVEPPQAVVPEWLLLRTLRRACESVAAHRRRQAEAKAKESAVVELLGLVEAR